MCDFERITSCGFYDFQKEGELRLSKSFGNNTFILSKRVEINYKLKHSVKVNIA